MHAILALDFTTILEFSVVGVPCVYSVFYDIVAGVLGV